MHMQEVVLWLAHSSLVHHRAKAEIPSEVEMYVQKWRDARENNAIQAFNLVCSGAASKDHTMPNNKHGKLFSWYQGVK